MFTGGKAQLSIKRQLNSGRTVPTWILPQPHSVGIVRRLEALPPDADNFMRTNVQIL